MESGLSAAAAGFRIIETLKIRILFLVLILPVFASAASARDYSDIPEELLTPDEAGPLGGRTGYLLLDLDVAGTAPSFEFVRVADWDRRDSYDPPAIFGRIRNTQVVNLGGKTDGFYLIRVPAGLYQIIRVNVPYFDLPYQVDTGFRRQWRFSVQAGKTNYLGKFYVNQSRAARTVDVRLTNRIASDIDRWQSELGPLLAESPLRMGTGYRDDFLQDLVSRQSD